MSGNAAPIVVAIRAELRWNDTGIRLEAGGTYDLLAEGTWTDLFVPSGPDGNPDPSWMQRRAARWLRVKEENYFALIGALDRDLSTAFRIGHAARGFRATRSGQLTCFANDVPGFYWNNRGAVRLTVTRTG